MINIETGPPLTNTPEVDAAGEGGDYAAMVNLALQLERERNEAKELEKEVAEAWQIIRVLAMNTLDSEGETWPRALLWLHRNDHLKPTP